MDFSRLRPDVSRAPQQGTTYVHIQRELGRLLAFAGWTIDDVVTNPVAKRDVYNWFKTDRRMKRRIEVIELEKQWNAVG